MLNYIWNGVNSNLALIKHCRNNQDTLPSQILSFTQIMYKQIENSDE